MRSLLSTIFAALAGYLLGIWVGGPPFSPASVVTIPPAEGAGTPTPSDKATEDRALSQPNGAKEDLDRALRGMNPFAAAPRVAAWLESATAEDFAALARDRKNFPRPIFNAFQHEFRDAYYEAFLERWFAVNPDAFSSIRLVHAELKKDDAYEADEFLKSAARVRPELLLEPSDTESRDYFAPYQTEALRVIATRDVRKARAFAETLPEKQKQGADAAIVRGIAESDPLSALALARDLDPQMASGVHGEIIAAAARIGPGMLRQVFAADEGRLDKVQLQSLLLRYPDLAKEVEPVTDAKPLPLFLYPSEQLFHQADLISPEERAGALQRVKDMPPGIGDSVAAALVCAWARDEPEKAATWAITRAKTEEPTNAANQAAHFVFLRWIHSDRTAALTWFRALPPSPLRDAIGTNASTFIAESGEMAAALELCRPTGSKVDQGATAHLVQIYAERDHAGAAAWMAKLPDEAVNAEAVSALLREWYPQNPTAVAEWLETLPPGLRRDEGLKGFVTRAARESAETAAAWAETIDEPQLRQDAAATIFYALHHQDPARAREWIRGLSGVDPTWLGRFLRRVQ